MLPIGGSVRWGMLLVLGLLWDMKELSTDSIINLAVIIAGGMLTLIVLLASGRDIKRRGHKDIGDIIFRLICICVVAFTCLRGLEELLKQMECYDAIPWLGTAAYAVMVLISYLWLLYADYMIYGSKDYLFRKYIKFSIPLVICFVLLATRPVWLFIPGLSDGFIQGVVLVTNVYKYVLMALYFLMSVIVAARYDIRVKKLHFFHVYPLAIPVLAGIILSIPLDISLWPLGYSVGLLSLYLSLRKKWKYDDPETGFYNAKYLDEIKKPVAEKKRAYQSAMELKLPGSMSDFSAKFRHILPREMEEVRLDEHRLLLLIGSGGKSLTGRFEKMFKGYDKDIEIRTFISEDYDDAVSFMNRIMNL